MHRKAENVHQGSVTRCLDFVAIYNNENLPIGVKICDSKVQIFTNTNLTTINYQKITQSGYTGVCEWWRERERERERETD